MDRRLCLVGGLTFVKLAFEFTVSRKWICLASRLYMHICLLAILAAFSFGYSFIVVFWSMNLDNYVCMRRGGDQAFPVYPLDDVESSWPISVCSFILNGEILAFSCNVADDDITPKSGGWLLKKGGFGMWR